MQGKTHAAWGVAAGLTAGALAGAASWQDLSACALVGGLAGLAPDWLQINIPGVKQIKGMFGHRGFSHWLWTPILLAYALYTFCIAPRSLSMAFFCAWGSHIALDALSNGVPAFWPFGRLTLAHIKTGARLDNLIGGAGLIFAALTAYLQI